MPQHCRRPGTHPAGPSYKPKSRARCLHRRILLNIQRIYTNPSQTLPKDWRGGNVLKDILWSHHQPDTKTRQRYHEKRKLQANILDEYRCKNSQQSISQLNLTTHKTDHIPQPSGIHPKLTRIVQYTQINVMYQIKKKVKTYMIVSIDAEKPSDKIQHPPYVYQSGYI